LLLQKDSAPEIHKEKIEKIETLLREHESMVQKYKEENEYLKS
jgi:hypothetical protein